MTDKRRFPLLLAALSAICTALSLFFLLLWVVNLEEAIRLYFADVSFLARFLPASIYQVGMRCAADLSTVSTLVPFLMFAFPAVQGFRAVGRHLAESEEELIWRPYPPHFAFFLIMLGLTGTLYGLLIGLQSSGVEALASTGLKGEAVQDSVERLLSGTATAVLSSLVGLIGAFIAARPLAWLFCISLPLEIAEELPEDLEATVNRLSEGLGRMDRTVREVTRSLEPLPFAKLAQQLEQLETQNAELVAGVSRMCTVLERCANGLANAEAIDQKLEHALTQLSGLRTEQAAHTNTLNTAITGAGDRVEAAIGEQAAGQAAMLETLRELGETAREGNRQQKQARSRLRKAFSTFAEERASNE